LQSYIVRINRGEQDGPEDLLGQVVDVQEDEAIPFRNRDELMRILCSVKGIPEPEENNK
jgi:hypothetical protein